MATRARSDRSQPRLRRSAAASARRRLRQGAVVAGRPWRRAEVLGPLRPAAVLRRPADAVVAGRLAAIARPLDRSQGQAPLRFGLDVRDARRIGEAARSPAGAARRPARRREQAPLRAAGAVRSASSRPASTKGDARSLRVGARRHPGPRPLRPHRLRGRAAAVPQSRRAGEGDRAQVQGDQAASSSPTCSSGCSSSCASRRSGSPPTTRHAVQAGAADHAGDARHRRARATSRERLALVLGRGDAQPAPTDRSRFQFHAVGTDVGGQRDRLHHPDDVPVADRRRARCDRR